MRSRPGAGGPPACRHSRVFFRAQRAARAAPRSGPSRHGGRRAGRCGRPRPRPWLAARARRRPPAGQPGRGGPRRARAAPARRQPLAWLVFPSCLDGSGSKKGCTRMEPPRTLWRNMLRTVLSRWPGTPFGPAGSSMHMQRGRRYAVSVGGRGRARNQALAGGELHIGLQRAAVHARSAQTHNFSFPSQRTCVVSAELQLQTAFSSLVRALGRVPPPAPTAAGCGGCPGPPWPQATVYSVVPRSRGVYLASCASFAAVMWAASSALARRRAGFWRWDG